MNLDNLNRKLVKMQFTGKARERTYRKLVSFLRNGVALPKALEIMWKHASDDGKNPKNPTAMVLKEWIKKVNNGKSFGVAVSGWVPDGDRIVIEAGETAGSLDTAIENALFISEGSKKIKSTIIKGLAYPVVLVLVAIGFMVLFGVKIIPAFEEVSPRDKWQGLAANMATVSDFVNYAMAPIGAALACVAGLISWSMPRWTGPLRAKFDRYPPWSLYRLNAGAGFMLSVAALVKAGVQIPEILRILQRGATPWYHERISGALRHVSNGINLGEALYRTRLNFPDEETVKDLRSYAELDGFDETLEQLGRQWINESVEKIEAQMGIIRNASFIILGVVFATIASGIFALQQQAASGL